MTRPHPALLALLLLLAVSSCQFLGTHGLPPRESPTPAAQADVSGGVPPPQESPFTPGFLGPEEIPGEITKLAWISRNPEVPEAERAEAMRRLVLLHLAPKNPARSQALAAEAQANYLTMQPPETARQEGEIWLNLIREGLAREQLQQQQSQKIREKEGALAALGEEKQRLAQKLAAVEKINAKLKEDIEKLKFIDLSLEKKRKNLR